MPCFFFVGTVVVRGDVLQECSARGEGNAFLGIML